MNNPPKKRSIKPRISARSKKPVTKKRICGANRKNGKGICTAKPMGNGRCRNHGGVTQNNRSADRLTKEQADSKKKLDQIYTDVGLLDDEYEVYPSVVSCIGTLDQEIAMLRIKLRRLHQAQRRLDAVHLELNRNSGNKKKWQSIAIASGVLSIQEIEKQAGQVLVGTGDDRHLEDYTREKIVRKIERYDVDIMQFTKTIAKLEGDRRDLIDGNSGGADFLRDLAISLRGVEVAARNTMPGCEEFGSGNYEFADE